MRISRRLLIAWGMAVVAAALLAGVWGHGDTVSPARAQDDRCETLQQWADAFNRGEIDLENHADDVAFDGPAVCAPDGCVGRDAYRNYLEYLVALDTQFTFTSCEVSGNTVATTVEIRGRHEQEAGVERSIFSLATEFADDTVLGSRTVAVAMEDPQTAHWFTWWFGTVQVTFEMGPGRDADQSPGVAALERYPDFSAVSVRIAPDPTGVPQPVNIHEGTCADLGPVAFPLTDMAGGVSHTVLEDIPASDLQTGNYAIAVQKSENDPDVFVACGDIPAQAAEEAPPAAEAPPAEEAAPELIAPAPALPAAGSGGLIDEGGGGIPLWWYGLAAGGALLIMGGLAGVLKRTHGPG